jgi:quinol monooxygenase YgiN
MTNTTSSCAAGIIVVMNAFIDPSNTEKYLKLTKPIAEEFRKHPENLFTAISVNPTDLGHVRIVHGWTKDSTWFQEVIPNLPFES